MWPSMWPENQPPCIPIVNLPLPMESLNLDLQGSQHQQRALNDEGIACTPNELTIGENEGIAYTPLSKLLNAINVIEAWGY